MRMIETQQLEYLKMYVAERLSYESVLNMDLSVEETADFYRDLVFRLTTNMLSENLPKAIETKSQVILVPASPFQHWKMKHQDSWWLKKFISWKSVKYNKTTIMFTVDMRRHYAYPKSQIRQPDPKFGPYIRVAQISTSLDVDHDNLHP